MSVLRQIKPVHIVIISILLYVLFIALSDVRNSVQILLHFSPLLFILMLGMALMNYFIRFLKWQYYLKLIEVHIPGYESLQIFLSGFSMTLTPGKSGELIKSQLLTEYGYPISHTSSVIFVERLTDLFGMIILALLGAMIFGFLLIPLTLLVLILGIMVIVIQYEHVAKRIINVLCRLPLICNYKNNIERLYLSSRILTHSTPLSIGIGLSVISWFFECLCLYIALIGTNVDIPVINSVFIFALSSIAGIIAMLPGGLGATEAVMVVLLSKSGVALSDATAATILCRLATLWFAVAIGFCALAYFQRKHTGRDIQKGEENSR